ncbi:hypothetical protein [Bradyrhizobium japonicum]|uniref:hypothetical protein n=1 Tax=Bradyrhizobium japonicum TaxID=375 RepID=UPI00200BF8D1|nr:hypothetical protein [Bradyrhizobium japonicum]UQD96078.1 hypothetical protein JEY30_31545 [Bradyrhizobium japonicum]
MKLDAQTEARNLIAPCFERLTDREEYVFLGRAGRADLGKDLGDHLSCRRAYPP